LGVTQKWVMTDASNDKSGRAFLYVRRCRACRPKSTITSH
jgi:hypothetical protein